MSINVDLLQSDIESSSESPVVWGPQPGPQFDAIMADWCDEIFFGGAKYGGKTDFLLGDFLVGAAEHKENWSGILIRESLPEMDEILRRSYELFSQAGGIYKVGERTWVFPELGKKGGACAQLKLRHLARPEDFSKYNGHSYPWIGFDELGQWPTPEGYDLMKGCLRWGGAVVDNKRIRSTGNPGGVGQQWIKRRFIDHAPQGFEPFYDEETRMHRMFIPSKITDNKKGLEKDPNYIHRLKGMGSPALVRAMLEGDWGAVVGSFFPEFNAQHILYPFHVPDHLMRFTSYDWGSASPFSVGWWFVSDGSVQAVNNKGENIIIPAGALVRYREWYGMDSVTGEGLRLRNEDQAKRILELENGEIMTYRVADPSIFGDKGGESIGETFAREKVIFRRADNKRIDGWAQVRNRLIGKDDRPMIYFFNTCQDAIRTMQSLPHDRHNYEDVDTNSEDHAADEIRYACMSRPYIIDKPKPKEKWKPKPISLQSLTDPLKIPRKRHKRI